jgi:hypothetical protein
LLAVIWSWQNAGLLMAKPILRKWLSDYRSFTI